MEQLDFNTTLGRESTAAAIKDILVNFESNKSNLSLKRGIYIYGAPGSGKTEFITSLLKELDYDVVKYDAGDIRNKSIIETITKHNMADKSVLSLFQEKARPIAILMDEIDGMNNGDKGGINSLIKLIRPKKTKKQKLEEVTFNPIICVSNYHIDKKIKELMKVCSSFELKCPTQTQIKQIIQNTMPELDGVLASNIVNFLQGDLRKLSSIYNIYQNHCSILKNEIIQNIFKPKSYNEDTKEITKKLINNKFSFPEHLTVMNETDRTIVGLLWHENIIDVIGKMPKNVSIPFYLKVLDNICFADYIDRITFQKQIWQFNEMSSLIKTFHNNKIYHDTFDKRPVFNPAEIRFTKVLTKYSTEYNNSLFIQNLCQQLGLDKKDTFSFFLDLRNNYSDEDIYGMFDSYDIGKLDINRMYRYLDKYTKNECEPVDI
jgi:DNA polymerase III delta prime subunit